MAQRGFVLLSILIRLKEVCFPFKPDKAERGFVLLSNLIRLKEVLFCFQT